MPGRSNTTLRNTTNSTMATHPSPGTSSRTNNRLPRMALRPLATTNPNNNIHSSNSNSNNTHSSTINNHRLNSSTMPHTLSTSRGAHLLEAHPRLTRVHTRTTHREWHYRSLMGGAVVVAAAEAAALLEQHVGRLRPHHMAEGEVKNPRDPRRTPA